MRECVNLAHRIQLSLLPTGILTVKEIKSMKGMKQKHYPDRVLTSQWYRQFRIQIVINIKTRYI